MGSGKIKVKDLKTINYIQDKSKSLAINIMSRHFKNISKEEQLRILTDVKNNPEKYLQHEFLSVLALCFTSKVEGRNFEEFELLKETGILNVFGRKNIEEGAIRQMEVAMQLPVTIQGALMPDAHHGYGLPIGGVLAAKNAVIPFGVGLDIGCRMSLVIVDAKADYLKRYEYQVKMALKEFTHFGIEGHLEFSQEHEVLDRPEFQETDLMRKLHPKAVKQLGSSGSGNHFVEFGTVVMDKGNALGLTAGEYVGILAHSGSRGLGASIAQFYTQLAMKRCKLPKHAQHLAWFDLDSELGQEYWRAMNLAGDYAKACHERIGINLRRALDLNVITTIGNHHNFAWRETSPEGETVIVHRKGATPARKGESGIIPGNMVDAGYIVTGIGEEASLFSASHGAGRRFSRNQARETITNSSMKKMLESNGVELIGGSTEESPLAYKSIDEVMSSQKMLVKTEGKFYPKIVRMNKE
jgi:tRNA-splicing ligase RtcB (3'-phosphate/5'-hydroxy nucleic acid ligase)